MYLISKKNQNKIEICEPNKINSYFIYFYYFDYLIRSFWSPDFCLFWFLTSLHILFKIELAKQIYMK